VTRQGSATRALEFGPAGQIAPGTVQQAPGAAGHESLLQPQGGGWSRWPGQGTTTITYRFLEPGQRDDAWLAPSDDILPVPGALKAAFLRAFAAWEAVALVDFVPHRGPGHADLQIGYDNVPSVPAAGVTFLLPGKAGAIDYAEIWLNQTQVRPPAKPGGFSYMVVMHEVGHALGLKHPFEGGAQLARGQDHRGQTVMSYEPHPGTGFVSGVKVEPRTPMPLDVRAVQDLYGPNWGTGRGDNLYRYPDGIARIETLWDAAGRDTIDASGQLLPVVLDLRPGAFSSLGRQGTGVFYGRRAKDNLAIAAGTWIENAIGGKGADRIYGNALANRLEGRGGDDLLVGRGGADVLVGGGGRDVFRGTLPELDGDRILDFGVGDRIELVGVRSSTLAWRLEGNRLLLDGDGDGRVDAVVRFNQPPAGRLALKGGGGVVRLELERAPDAQPEGGSGVARGTGERALAGAGDGRAGAERGADGAAALRGGAGRDLLKGGDGADRLFGLAGDDRLFGRGGADLLDGGPGNDRLFGHQGNDRLLGGPGNDRLLGHQGDDVLDGGAGDDRLLGHQGDDRLLGGPGNDRLLGHGGRDELRGGPGHDRLLGQDGADRLYGDSGRDRLLGQRGDDRLDGGAGNDRLLGGAGNDLLVPGPGDDWVVGGPGLDRVRILGRSVEFTLTRKGKLWLVEDRNPANGDEGRDVIKSAEVLIFDDQSYRLTGKQALALAAPPPPPDALDPLLVPPSDSTFG